MYIIRTGACIYYICLMYAHTHTHYGYDTYCVAFIYSYKYSDSKYIMFKNYNVRICIEDEKTVSKVKLCSYDVARNIVS